MNACCFCKSQISQVKPLLTWEASILHIQSFSLIFLIKCVPLSANTRQLVRCWVRGSLLVQQCIHKTGSSINFTTVRKAPRPTLLAWLSHANKDQKHVLIRYGLITSDKLWHKDKQRSPIKFMSWQLNISHLLPLELRLSLDLRLSLLPLRRRESGSRLMLRLCLLPLLLLFLLPSPLLLLSLSFRLLPERPLLTLLAWLTLRLCLSLLSGLLWMWYTSKRIRCLKQNKNNALSQARGTYRNGITAHIFLVLMTLEGDVFSIMSDHFFLLRSKNK